jgi:uncharacterized membrane protein YiaA
MDINFDNVNTIFNSPFSGWTFGLLSALVVLVLTSMVMTRKSKDNTTQNQKRATAVGMACLMLALVGMVPTFIVGTLNANLALNGGSEVVKEAVQETYGIELTNSNMEDLGAASIVDPASDEFVLYGSSALVVDGDITEVKLVQNDGEYQLVAGDVTFKELPRV